MTRGPSGISAVVNLSMAPLSAMVFSALWGQAHLTRNRLAAITLGGLGLGILFLPQTQIDMTSGVLMGMLAIAIGAVCYGAGSVILKARHIDCPPRVSSAIQCLMGGAMLSLFSFVIEPVNAQTFVDLFTPAAFLSRIFLVVIGSVLAFTIYLALLASWGASRVTVYAFVCPVIALIEGAWFAGERISSTETVAILILLTATWLGVRPEGVVNKT